MLDTELVRLKENWLATIGIDLQITRRCNYRCNHCFVTDYVGDMSFEKFKKIIDDDFFSNEKFKGVVFFSGGEIFLNNDIAEFFKYVKLKDIPVTFVTNGSLVNQDIIEYFRGADISVGISLDGPAEFHNKFRNNDKAFEKVENCIKLFKENDIKFGIITSVIKSNLAYVESLADYCISKGVKQIRYQVVTPRGNAKLLKTENLLLTHSQMEELLKKVITIKGEHIFELSAQTLGQFKSEITEHGCKFGLHFGETCHSDSTPWPKTIAIDYKGDIYPIHHDLDEYWKIGNIEDGILNNLNRYYGSKKHLELLNLLKVVFEKDILLSEDEIVFPDLLLDNRMKNISKEEINI